MEARTVVASPVAVFIMFREKDPPSSAPRREIRRIGVADACGKPTPPLPRRPRPPPVVVAAAAARPPDWYGRNDCRCGRAVSRACGEWLRARSVAAQRTAAEITEGLAARARARGLGHRRRGNVGGPEVETQMITSRCGATVLRRYACHVGFGATPPPSRASTAVALCRRRRAFWPRWGIACRGKMSTIFRNVDHARV